MINKTRKRLEQLEGIIGSKHRLVARVEYCNLSPEGELVPLSHLSAAHHDDRPVEKLYRVVFVDCDGNGGPGPRYRAYKERCEIEKGESEAANSSAFE
ncbi:MAG TPA: hypothetical protein VH639_04395 [Bryobacteraceae bacterium]